MRSGRAADVALLVSVFTITLVRLRWPVGGNDVYLSDFTVAAFLGLFLVHRFASRDRSVPRTVVVLLAFLALLSVVYLAGYFNLETSADRSQFTKGLAKFALHFAFLIAAVAHLARRSTRFYWQTLGAFVAGMALNGAYAVLEFVYAMGGRGFLDPLMLGPITGDTSEGIIRFGVVARRGRLPDERAHARRQPPRGRARRPDPHPPTHLPAPGARSSAAPSARHHPGGPRAGGGGDVLAQRRARAGRRPGHPRRAVPAADGVAAAARSGRRARGSARGRRPPVLDARLRAAPRPDELQRARDADALRPLRAPAARARLLPPPGTRAEHVLHLLRVPHGPGQLGPALLLHRDPRRDRNRGHDPVHGLHRLRLPAPGLPAPAWGVRSPRRETSPPPASSRSRGASRLPWRVRSPRTSSTSRCRCTTSSSSCSWRSLRRSCSRADEAAGVRARCRRVRPRLHGADGAGLRRPHAVDGDPPGRRPRPRPAAAGRQGRGPRLRRGRDHGLPHLVRLRGRRRRQRAARHRGRHRPLPRAPLRARRRDLGSRSRTTRSTRRSPPTWSSTSTTRPSPAMLGEVQARPRARRHALPLHAEPAPRRRADEGARPRARPEPDAHRPALRAASSRPGSSRPATSIEINSWRPSFVRVLRSVERVAGPRLQLFRYRLCLRARVPER